MTERDKMLAILRELFGKGGDSVWMQPPFLCDYGTNIELGEHVFFNFDCIVLDVCRVHPRTTERDEGTGKSVMRLRCDNDKEDPMRNRSDES